jgi:DNA polymerase III epsilon subunit-like protein
MNICYYLLDLETTGLSVDKHEVTQISVIRCEDRNQLNKYIKAEFPKNASWEALKVTGRTHADLLKGDSKEEVVEICDTFFNQDGATNEHRCMVGHNVHRFDMRFANKLWKKCGKIFPANLWLDTLPFTKEYAIRKGIDSPNFKLSTSCDIVGVKRGGADHNAKSDTRNNYKLWLKLMESGIGHLQFIKRAAIVEDDEE